jgi:uncharacterized protein
MKPDNDQTIRDLIRMVEERDGGGPALYEAVRWSIRDEVVRLLDAGIDPDTRSGDRQSTPLMAANNAEIAELLVKRGADVNSKDRDGRTPLVWYLIGLNRKASAIKFINTLLRLGATVPDLNDEYSPFIQAQAKYGDEVVALLKKGGDIL